MNERSKLIFAFLAIAIVTTIAVSLVSLAFIQAGLGYYLLANRDSLANYASVVNDSLKLRFTLSINSSALATGQSVEIEVNEQNTLLLTNTVTGGHNWPISGLSLSPCGVLNYPMGFAIFQGYHLQNNLPSADRLTLFSPGVYFCPLILSNINSYVFDPGSDSASINGSCGSNPGCTIPIQSEGAFKGSWGGSIPLLSNAAFHSFSPGVYTVVGGDEWGNLLVLHFVIS